MPKLKMIIDAVKDILSLIDTIWNSNCENIEY